MEIVKEVYDVPMQELWDTLNRAAGGDKKWGTHNKNLYYSHAINGYRYRDGRKFIAEDGSMIEGALELVIQFQKDYAKNETPMFVVPITEELRALLNKYAKVSGKQAQYHNDGDNVVLYINQYNILTITYTSAIEGKYDTPQYRDFRNTFTEYHCETIIVMPDVSQ